MLLLRAFKGSISESRTKIDLTLTSDEEVGDGTTSVMILASELLAYAKPLFNSHPTIIDEDYNKLVSIALRRTYLHETTRRRFQTLSRLLLVVCWSWSRSHVYSSSLRCFHPNSDYL
ncbi:hypothetical protein GEMRC1_006543 [Eukaryota sp. GEM-RC1]